MNILKKIKPWMACVLAVVILLGSGSNSLPTQVQAASSSEIQEEIDELKEQMEESQAQMDALDAQRKENLSAIEDIIGQKNIIDQQVALLHGQINNINAQIASYSLLIADKQDELSRAEKRLTDLNDKYKIRIRAMEENGELSYWEVLLQASSFSDLLDRLSMIQEINDADQRRLKELKTAAEAVESAQAELESEKAELEVAKTTLQEAQEILAAKRLEADALLAQLIARGEEYDALMLEMEDNHNDLAQELAQKNNEYDEAVEREWQEYIATLTTTTKPNYNNGGNNGGGNGGGNNSGVTWVRPLKYIYVVSPFGYRIHPIHGDWRMHYGVDLDGSTGDPIYATRSGTVSVASYEAGGAGYYVQINHGDGYRSIYMHMTHYIVYPGQSVSAGEIIGYVGSTGGSTGPHLHFGISYNGSYVNPMDYIS